MMDRFLCERCDHFVSGSDLLPVSNYFIRDDIKVRSDRELGGQCVCGGLCYLATDSDMIEHMERELEQRELVP